MNMTSKAVTERQHYFLVTGEIVFRTKEEDSSPNALRLNAVVTSQDERFAVAQIGRAQQALQLQFFKRMEDPMFQVVDVVILALAPLGQFTPEEFNAAPQGTELREMPPNQVTVGNA